LIARGTCHVYFAFLVASQVDLERAEAITARRSERPRLRRDRRAPAYLDFDPLPLQFGLPGDPIPICEGFASDAEARVTVFDFGAVSLDYSVPFAAGFDALAGLSSALYEHTGLRAAARARVAEVRAALRSAFDREREPDEDEQYAVFDVAALEPGVAPGELLVGSELADGLARVLRTETRPLSQGRVADALRLHIAYGLDDLLVVDWSTAVALGGSEDERRVLEFANVELLELRCLDKRLDEDLLEANRRLHRPRRWVFGGADLRQVAKLQVDSAMLYESVDNAVSLLGDQWLADVYGLIAERNDLEKWQASVTHKLATLESIYAKIADEAAARRSELLEMIIIALIALEVSWGSLFQGVRNALWAWLEGT
jgi:hypothetical protein